MKKKFEKIASLKEQMRALLDVVEAENRALTQDEQTQFDALKRERDMLAMQIERATLDKGSLQTTVVNRAALFAHVADAIVNNRSVDFGGQYVDGQQISVVERAEVLTDTTDIANLVPVTIGEIIEPLEKGLLIDKLGIKMQTGCVGELTFPTLAAIEASINGENDAVSDTELTIGKITSTPKRVAISIPVSKRAIHQSAISLQGIVLKQMSLAVARLLNKWMFSQTTLSGASAGPFVKTTSDVTYATSLTFTNVVELETTVANAGVDVTDPTAAYVCTPKVYGALKSTPIENGSPKMIIEDNMMNGYPVLVTNYMAADSIGFGVFSYCGIGQFGDLDIIIDPYSASKQRIVNFVLNGDYDIVVARTEAFALATKATV